MIPEHCTGRSENIPFYLSADQQQRVPGGLGSDGERDLGDLVVVAGGGGGHNDAGLGRRGADH